MVASLSSFLPLTLSFTLSLSFFQLLTDALQCHFHALSASGLAQIDVFELVAIVVVVVDVVIVVVAVAVAATIVTVAVLADVVLHSNAVNSLDKFCFYCTFCLCNFLCFVLTFAHHRHKLRATITNKLTGSKLKLFK